MAPIANNKRRRGEDEVRKPKKKIHVKRQKHYHSSSEEEDDDRPVVSDAPVKRALAVEGKSKNKQQPKSILKPALKPSAAAEDEVASASEEESEGEDEDVGGVEVDETELNTALNAAPADEESDADSVEEHNWEVEATAIAQDAPSTEESDFDDSASDTSLTSSNPNLIKTKKKRSDPTAFSTSISRILSTKLTTTKRADPVLSRSAVAATANKNLTDQKLETAARNQLKVEKRTLLSKGRERDVLGLNDANVETGKVQEQEKRLKKVAQRGVVRLFNAVRAAQVRAEKGEEIVRGEGVVGVGQRAERVGELSKEGFLDLISKGGKGEVGAAA